jgi:hypothetical protein
VIHSYEWFQRASTGIDEEETTTKKDTLEWIRYARPKVSESVIRAALPDAGAQAQASRLMKAYDRFDGNDSTGSPFSVAVNRYTEALSELPELISKEETDRFEERFWDWYDKRNVVPEIDTLVRMNMYEYEGPKPSDEQLENLKRAIEAERDIDRRTVLALEYVKFSKWDGVPLLGEILESRIYTKYLLEAWISWRANAQMDHSPSSFGVIANNYYDKVRTICLDTMSGTAWRPMTRTRKSLNREPALLRNHPQDGVNSGKQQFLTTVRCFPTTCSSIPGYSPTEE